MFLNPTSFTPTQFTRTCNTFQSLQTICYYFYTCIASYSLNFSHLSLSFFFFLGSHHLYPTMAFSINPFLSAHSLFLHRFVLQLEGHSFSLEDQTTSAGFFCPSHLPLYSVHIHWGPIHSWPSLFLFHGTHFSSTPCPLLSIYFIFLWTSPALRL